MNSFQREEVSGGNHHVHVLATSILNLEHLLCAFALGAELVTVPAKVLEERASKGSALPAPDFVYQRRNVDGHELKPISYQQLDLNSAWENSDQAHDLTTQGIQKFVKDCSSTLKKSA